MHVLRLVGAGGGKRTYAEKLKKENLKKGTAGPTPWSQVLPPGSRARTKTQAACFANAVRVPGRARKEPVSRSTVRCLKAGW